MIFFKNCQKLFSEHVINPNTSSEFSGEDKEILQVLCEILRKQLVDMPMSRIIIFVTTRLICEKLSHYLNIKGIIDQNDIAVAYVTS